MTYLQSGDDFLDCALFDVRVALAIRDGIEFAAVSPDDVADYIAEHWDDAEHVPPMREHARFTVRDAIDRDLVTDEEVQEILADDESLRLALVDYYEATADECAELYDQVCAVLLERRH